MKILLAIILFFLIIALLMLLSILFLKVYIYFTVSYTDLKKECTIACTMFKKIVKLKISIIYSQSHLNINFDGSIFNFKFDKLIKKFFSPQEFPSESASLTIKEESTSSDTSVKIPQKELNVENEKHETDRQEKSKKHKQSKKKQMKSKEKKHIQTILTFIKMAGKIHTISKQFLQKVKVESLLIRVTYGIEDAALTGKSLGFIWSTIGVLLGWIHANLQVNCEPNVELEPFYQGTMLKGISRFSISFRPFYVIFYGIKIYFLLKKEWKRKDTQPSSKDDKKGMEI